MARKQYSEEDWRQVMETASRHYVPGEGQPLKRKTKKDKLSTKLNMALQGRRYKTPAAKRAKAKRNELDRRGSTVAGTAYSADADAVLKKIKQGKY